MSILKDTMSGNMFADSLCSHWIPKTDAFISPFSLELMPIDVCHTINNVRVNIHMAPVAWPKILVMYFDENGTLAVCVLEHIDLVEYKQTEVD